MAVLDLPEVRPGLIAALGLDESFRPHEPETLEDTGLADSLVEGLICKYLLVAGTKSGHGIADAICLPFRVLDNTLKRLRGQQYIVHSGSAALNDYVFALTDLGRQRAQSEMAACAYVGPAPVRLSDYVLSVNAQTVRDEATNRARMEVAFKDVSIEARLFEKLGPAINSGKGMFLYGPPGNGKTTIAKRITACYSQSILVPYAVVEDGQIIKVFDGACHERVEESTGSILLIKDADHRWVRVRRPIVVVGGELTLDSLELRFDAVTKISQASLQMKSNGGCLLIDDFGRQRVNPTDLLNRWIIPLENRIDYLTLPTGKKIEVPFEQLIIFSTNLEPSTLTDDAFLRRIPYKIEIVDPTSDEFHQLFQSVLEARGHEYRREVVDELIETHYRRAGRPLRRCQPRDLVEHLESYCVYHEVPFELRKDLLDLAIEVYFTAANRAPSP